MAATKKAAKQTKPRAKKATPQTRKTKPKTSSAPGESARAHNWLMHSQEVSTEGLPAKADVRPEPDNNPIEPDTGRDAKTGQFLKGEYRGGPGRKKGSRNKLAEAFLTDLLDDWVQHGVAAIAEVRETKPDQYLKAVVASLPKQLDVRVSELADMDETQLDKRIEQLSAELRGAMAILDPAGQRAN